MGASGCHGQSTLGHVLSTDIAKVDVVLGERGKQLVEFRGNRIDIELTIEKADSSVLSKAIGIELIGDRQYAKRYRQIKARGLFWELSGCKVYDDPSMGASQRKGA